MITMKLQSIIDPKKKARVREALRKGDASLLRKKKKPSAKPLVEQPTAQKPLTPEEQEKLNRELTNAASVGDTQKVKDLIQKGADVNSCSLNARTPLMFASYQGHTKTAELLIQKGADVDSRDDRGQTSLIQASFFGRVQVVDLLIQNKADVNAKDNSDWTSLMHAIHGRHSKTKKLLRKHGAKE